MTQQDYVRAPEPEEIPEPAVKRMSDEEIRLDERQRIQKYIDENNIYQVEFEHYDYSEKAYGQWVPLKTKRVDIMEVFNDNK